MHKERCIRCPSQSGTLIILGVSFILAFAIAILSSKNLKPEHVVAVRGFICFVTLCQLVISLDKSGDANNRPPSMTIMFDGVQFFSFSLDIVRPECSVAIDAVLKATIIGALPVLVAIIIVMVSAFMAVMKSHLLRQTILNSVPNLMQEMTIGWILYHAFLDAFVIQKPVFHRELKLWVALSPFRRIQENLKLRHFNPIVASAKTKYSKKFIQFARSHDISWLMIEKNCEDQFAEVTKIIQATVNGILSMILLMYAGTVQASFVVLDCVSREGSAYLRIDMETECTQTNDKYRGLFAVSSLSWILYGAVVPSGLLIFLHSSWSKFVAFSHPAAFNYMFKSLIGQYGRETPSWEVIQLLKKFMQFGIPALSRQSLAQALIGVFLGTIYETLVLSFQPYLLMAMNKYESVQNTLILSFDVWIVVGC